MIAMAIALVGYIVFPTAPPRFMPEWGFVDSVSDLTHVSINEHSSSISAITNMYAAVPSMHVAFALMIGWTLARLVRLPARARRVGGVPVHDRVRDHRHGQPLHPRRDARRTDRRRLRLRRELAGASATGGVALLGRPQPRADGEQLDAATPARSVAPGAARARARARTPIGQGERRELVRNRLIESRLTPNAISLTGLALNVVAAVLVWERLFFLGGVAFIVGSIMDTLDGRYSRMSGKGTPFGAFLDSTLDRIEEGIVLTAVAGYFALRHNQAAAAGVVVAVLASLMVSYTRARAEALGVECKVGIATRPVRVVILSIGLVFAKGASLGSFELLEPAVYVLAALSVFTVGQRIWHVRQALTA